MHTSTLYDELQSQRKTSLYFLLRVGEVVTEVATYHVFPFLFFLTEVGTKCRQPLECSPGPSSFQEDVRQAWNPSGAPVTSTPRELAADSSHRRWMAPAPSCPEDVWKVHNFSLREDRAGCWRAKLLEIAVISRPSGQLLADRRGEVWEELELKLKRHTERKSFDRRVFLSLFPLNFLTWNVHQKGEFLRTLWMEELLKERWNGAGVRETRFSYCSTGGGLWSLRKHRSLWLKEPIFMWRLFCRANASQWTVAKCLMAKKPKQLDSFERIIYDHWGYLVSKRGAPTETTDSQRYFIQFIH